MSYLNDLPTRESPPRVRQNILGATGLSRATLAQVIAEIGLFGGDSELPRQDQAVVQSVIGPLPGLGPVEAPSTDPARSRAVAELTRDALAGAGQAGALTRDAAARAGLNTRQIQEVQRVVTTVRDVFGTAATLPVAA